GDESPRESVRRNLLENAEPFPSDRRLEIMKAGNIAAGMGKAADVSAPHRLAHPRKHDRNRAGFFQQRRQRWVRRDEEHIWLAGDQFGRRLLRALDTFPRKPIFDLDVLSFDPAEIAQAIAEDVKVGLPDLVCFGKAHQYADAAQVITLLRKCGARPSR